MNETKGNDPELDISSRLLQHGDNIKPILNEQMVRVLAEKLYEISCLQIKELNSYDDKNYKIIVNTKVNSPVIENYWPHGYILKIMNSLDSKKVSFVEAQNKSMIYLAEHHINCPNPVKNVHGNYFSLEKLNGKDHIVRLLEFQPGEILINVPKSELLFYQMGEYVANFCRILKGFEHTGFVNHKHIWQLENIPELEKFLDAIKDPEMVDIIDEVISKFKKKVVPKIPTLEKGLIHGDFHDENIIVNLKDSKKPGDWRITAIVDFGDFSISCYVFELAITMTYAMLLTGDLKTGGLILAGYSIVRMVPEEEFKLLKTCVAARLCQAFILCNYSHQMDPENDYLLSSQKSILHLLPLLWNENEDDVIALWKKVAEQYLTRS